MENLQSKADKDLIKAVEHRVKADGAGLVARAIKAGANVNVKDSRGNSVLISAVKNENIDIVKELVEAGADVKAKDRDGNLVLVSAVRTKNSDIVKELVKAGADGNAKDHIGNPVLVSAVKTKNTDIVKELWKAGADVNAKDLYGRPVLVSAVRTQYTDIVKELVKAKADGNAKDRDGNPVLVAAVRTKNSDIVKELVKAGADGNAKNLYERPVIVSAVATKNSDIIKELVKAGADVNAKDRYGHPVLASAVNIENIDVIKELVEAGADVNAEDGKGYPVLVSAVETENIDIMKELVKAGADGNVKDRNGNPVLVSAVETENIDIVKELVKAKADGNVKDQDGNPVLVSAVRTKNIHIVKELLKTRPDVNVIIASHADLSVIRPFHVAVAYPNVDVFKELVNSRANIHYHEKSEVSALHLLSVETTEDILHEVYSNKKNCNTPGIYNRTFLHYAASLGSHQQIKNILSLSDINVDLKDVFGNSPLHCAVQIGNLETIKALITAGCDRKAVDSSERTVLHLAAIYGHSDLIDIFVDEYGLDPLKLDNNQRNCLHYAVIFRHEDFVSALLQRDANSLKKYDTKDKSNKTPRDYLHSCEKNSLISKYLQGKSVETQIVPFKNSQNYESGISNAISINLSKILKEPSIGSVASITGHDNTMFVKYVKNVVEVVVQEAVPKNVDKCIIIGSDTKPVRRVVGCGSSFEGTKTGMPDEFDFLVKLDSKLSKDNEHEGYSRMERDPVTGSYGLWLWNILMSFWSNCQTKGKTSHSDGQRSMTMPLPPQRHPDRKTCTTWIWLYSDEMFTDLPVSIDFVPAVEVDLIHTKISLRPTWLMTGQTMRGEKKCYFVPKIPNEESKVMEKFKPESLHQLGRVSYPTLEVEHIQALEDRVMDVYIAAKCMRNVEVCGFKIENDEGDTKSVGELVTSYILKSVFLHLVELFLKSDMSLGKMVLMVYEQLEKCLERGHLPMFFDPDVNVLAGSKLSTEERLQVTRMMTRFVRSLYERDFSPEQRERDADEEKRVLEEQRVAHVDYDERLREYKKKRDECMARGFEYFGSQQLAPFLPIYLRQPSPNSDQG